jgi:rare lipoprotein A
VCLRLGWDYPPADHTMAAIAMVSRAITALIYLQFFKTTEIRSALIKLQVLAILLASLCTVPVLANLGETTRTESIRLENAKIQVGTASWYGRGHAGRITASGEPLNPRAMTCAHPTLPFGTVVRVTDIPNGKHVSLKVNDRGPYVRGRILDLSEGAARELEGSDGGLMTVRIEIVSIAKALAPG